MTQIKIYSTPWCGFCKAEKRWLDEKGIKYQDVNVEADPAQAREMVELSGQMGVPFTVITHADGHQVGILGFNQPQLTHELGLTA